MDAKEELLDHLLAYVGGLLEEASAIALLGREQEIASRLGRVSARVITVAKALETAEAVRRMEE